MGTAKEHSDVTAREDELLRLAFETVGHGYWQWEVDSDRWSFSPGLCSMFGYEPTELEPSQTTWLGLLHPDDAPRAADLLARCGKNQDASFAMEYRMRSRTGEWNWVLCRAVSTREDERGRGRRVVGVHIDISQRRRAEQALRESERRYRTIVESQGEGIASVDAEECFTYVNPAAESIFGVEPGSLTGRPLSDFLDPEQFDRVVAQTERRRRGESNTYELEFHRGDGERRIMLLTATPRYGEDGRYLGAFGVFRDITERKSMETALREQEERYRQLIESLPHGVALLQAGGTVYANQAAMQMLGYERLEQLASLDLADMLADDERDRVLSMLAGLLSGVEPGPVYCSTRAKRADGHEFPAEAYVSAIAHRGERALQLFMIDTSERLRAERAHARLEEQLQQAQRLEAIGRLAGGIARDFNNLLSPILLYAEIALEDLVPGAAHYEEFSQIRQSVKEAKALTQQLLAFGRRQVLKMVIGSLNDVVDEAHTLLRRLLRENVEIVLDLDETLGLVKGDPAQLQRVVVNLALNAQQSMPHGGTMTIRTANRTLDETECRERPGLRPGPYVVLEVLDTGRGMDAALLEQIFEPFPTTQTSGKGTGLGLATVHGIIKQHGGDIQVSSEPGQGSTFTVLLPRVGVRRTQSLRPPPTRPTQALEGTVLLVEHDEQLREQVRLILGRFGLQVMAATDGRAALAQVEQHPEPIDLLLTDLVMPRMNGRELFEALQRSRPELKVLYMSDHTDDVLESHGLSRDEIRCLPKPFSLHELLGAVREALEE
jgi:two-component system cell cycle sensor histidine kinase/response regulator CckA